MCIISKLCLDFFSLICIITDLSNSQHQLKVPGLNVWVRIYDSVYQVGSCHRRCYIELGLLHYHKAQTTCRPHWLKSSCKFALDCWFLLWHYVSTEDPLPFLPRLLFLIISVRTCFFFGRPRLAATKVATTLPGVCHYLMRLSPSSVVFTAHKTLICT